MTPRATATGRHHATKAAKVGQPPMAPSKPRTRAMARLSPLTWPEASVTMTLTGGWHFQLPEVESANRLWRAAKGRTYKSARATSDTAQARLRWRHVTPLAGPVTVTIAWHRARKAGDLDNKCKGTLDLLRQIAYGDDSQVVEIRMSRHDDATERPRLSVWVDPHKPHGLELHR